MKKITSLILVALLVIGMCIPCFADEAFTPSATTKSAPELTPISKDDPDTIAIIYDTLNDQTPFPDYDLIKKLSNVELSITAYADRATASDKIRTDLETAYTEILDAKSMSEICADLDTIAKSIHSTYTADNFVATDLFDLTLTNDVLDDTHVLYVRLRSVTDFGDQNPVVIHRTDAGWKAVPADKVVKLEDGSFTVEFDELCPVVLLKVVHTEVEDEKHCLAGLLCHDLFGGLLCTCWIFLGLLILLILILIIACIAATCRKNKLRKELKKKPEGPSWKAIAMAGLSFLAAGAFVKGVLHGGREKKKDTKKHKG